MILMFIAFMPNRATGNPDQGIYTGDGIIKIPQGPGPYGPDFIKKTLILTKNHKIINKNIKVVKLKILKVKTWFCDKDLSSLDSIN